MADRLAQLEEGLGRLAREIEILRAERDRLKRQVAASQALQEQVEALRAQNRALQTERRQLRERVASLIERLDAVIPGDNE